MEITKEEIIKRVRDAGVVGCGGAGFPTHVKIAAAGRRAEVVIANGAECEPLLKTDQYLMLHKSREVVRGLQLVMASSGASRGVVALKSKYHEACASLKKEVPPEIEVFEVGNFYPAGDEHVLVNEATGRIVPEAGIPIAVGVIVDNVATLINVCEAVDKGLAVTRKYVTVTGEVKRPIIVKCAIGSRIRDVVKLAQPIFENYVIVDGGAMMGEIADEDEVVTKTTGAFIVLSNDSSVVAGKRRSIQVSNRRAKSICDQCMDCTLTCPRNLLGHRIYPHKIMRMNFFDCDEMNETTSGSFLCSQCGLCEITCPQGLSPKAVFKSVKERLIKKGFKNILQNADLKVHGEKDLRKFSALRLIHRLGLAALDRPASLYEKVFVPPRVRIPLLQHTGSPAKPVVIPGAQVKEGSLIAAIPEGKLGANIHSSITGTVVKIDEKYIYIEQ